MTAKHRWLDWMFIGGFLVLLAVPAVQFRYTPASTEENRVLAQFDDDSFQIREWLRIPKRFEEFFSDHFGGRVPLIRLYHRMNLRLRINGSQNVIFGWNKWLYYNSKEILEDNYHENPFTERELQQWKRYQTIKYDALNRLGIRYLFCLCPNKHSIHPEYLPGKFREKPGGTRTDDWLAAMKRRTDVPVADVRGALRRATAAMPVYHPTDTHWNDYGCAVVQEIVLNRLNSMGADIPVRHYLPGEFRMKQYPGGDLARMLYLREYFSNAIPVHSSSLSENVSRVRLRKNTLYARMEREFINHHLSNGQRCLVIGDSFADRISSEFFRYFEHVLVVRLHDHQMRHLDPFAAYVEAFQPDVVIEFRVARFLKRTVPEDPPRANVDAYPDWLKRYFLVIRPEPVQPIHGRLQEHLPE